jgi:hypothetical protein
MLYGLESIGLIMGILVVVFALLMRSRPAYRKSYGVSVLVCRDRQFLPRGNVKISRRNSCPNNFSSSRIVTGSQKSLTVKLRFFFGED